MELPLASSDVFVVVIVAWQFSGGDSIVLGRGQVVCSHSSSSSFFHPEGDYFDVSDCGGIDSRGWGSLVRGFEEVNFNIL